MQNSDIQSVKSANHIGHYIAGNKHHNNYNLETKKKTTAAIATATATAAVLTTFDVLLCLIELLG